MNEERAIDYWDAPETERLTHDDKDEAIEAILEESDPLPETIEVCGYARMQASIAGTWEGDVLEWLLENLDENYGDPDGDINEPTKAMKEAEAAFLTVIQNEYKPWVCEEIIRETVNVRAWVEAHRPDWLEEAMKP